MAGHHNFGDFAKKVESDFKGALIDVTHSIADQGVALPAFPKHKDKADASAVSALGEGIVGGSPKIFGIPMQNYKGINVTEKVAIENLKRPAVAIVGGAQVEFKKEQIESLLDEVDVLVLGGEMIFAFYKAQGLLIGSTDESDENVRLAKSILEMAEAKGVKIVLPTHVVVADSDKEYANIKIVAASEIPDGWIGVDMASESVELIGNALEGAKMIVWNAKIGSSSYYESTIQEAVEKLINEHREKGASTILLDITIPERPKTDFGEIPNREIDGGKLGMFYFGC